jgi:phosphatidylserine/phosphatidylglycerophosphate/cardiolipin synthase-like enzyme
MDCKVKKCVFNSKDDIINEIIEAVNDAKKTIHLMHFWFSWKPIADSLINAHSKGIQVNILTDQRTLVKLMEDEQILYKISVLEHMNNNGIKNIKVYFKKLLHHKVIIIDDLLIIGSLNLFKRSIQDHVENLIFIKSENACKAYKKEFEFCYDDALELEKALEKTKYYVRN